MIRRLLVLKARPGRREELLRTVEVLGLRTLVEDQHGFLEVDVATSADDENEVVIVGSWSSRELYERWLAGRFLAGCSRRSASSSPESPRATSITSSSPSADRQGRHREVVALDQAPTRSHRRGGGVPSSKPRLACARAREREW